MNTTRFNDEVEFIDEKGFQHQIKYSDKIGEGGQGVVFRSKNKNILIKIAQTEKSGELKAVVDRIRSLELENLNFALPLISLTKFEDNHEGYVMRIMDDMEPISFMMKNTFKDEDELYNYYFKETGGIDKRLKILKNIAFNLYSIHSKGLVYGDISENNIFVSNNINSSEAWLIDCDNIEYCYEINSALGSQGFASPEIMKYLMGVTEKKEKNSIENDIYAFANLFVKLIFLCDPFRGGIAENNNLDSNDGWDSENEKEFSLEEKIDYGMISWIGEEDEENNPSFGFSPKMNEIISPELKKLLNRTLGHEGRNVPNSRPSMMLWYEEINNLLNSLKIFQCGHTFYKKNKKCLKCGMPPQQFLELDLNYGENKKNKKILKTIFGEYYSFKLTYGDLGLDSFDKSKESFVEFEKRGSKYFIKNKFVSKIKVTYDDELEGRESFDLKPNIKNQVSKFENLLVEVPQKNLRLIIREGENEV